MGDVQISARIPAEHERALRERAAREDRSFSAELRQAIRAHLASSPSVRLEKGLGRPGCRVCGGGVCITPATCERLAQ